MSLSRSLLCFALSLALAVTPAGVAAASGLAEWEQLPDMGLPASAGLSAGKEEKLGAGAVRHLRQQGAVLDDPEVKTYLQSLGERLAAHSPGAPFAFRYLPIRSPTINSFALPGGYVGVQTGLIEVTRNEDELAAVMAHETAHEVQRHIARQVVQNQNLGKLSIATLLAAVAAGALTGNPDVGIAAFGAGSGAALQKHINYTRQDEKEADRVGIRMLAAAGYDPEAMAGFFSHLAQSERLSGGYSLPPILQDHPVTSERIADAQARASRGPERKPRADLKYRLMRARCRVLASPNLDNTAAYFRGADRNDPANRYGLALAWAKQGKLEKAQKVFKALLQARPKNIHMRLEVAKIEQLRGHIQTALEQFKQQWQHSPNYPPLTLAYADALEQGKQFRTARQLLLHSGQGLDGNPKKHHLLAIAANRTQQPVEARYQLAVYYFLQGDYEPAIRQLQAGLKEKNITSLQRSKLKATLKRVQKAASEEA